MMEMVSLICNIDTYFIQVCNLSYERKIHSLMKYNETEVKGFYECYYGIERKDY